MLSKHWKNQESPQRITKNTNLLNKYNSIGINFPAEKDNSKKCEKTNQTIALNVLYAKNKKYISGSWETSCSFIDCKSKRMTLS